MSSEPLVSCLIATYNFAPFLARSIESVLTQNYPSERIEIIVVDDGSTDETPAVVAPYRDRLTYIRKPNGGLRSTINRALQEAHGDFIAFHSGDDVWLPGRLRRQVEELQSRPELGLIYGDMRVIDAEDRTLHESFWQSHRISPSRGRPVVRLMHGNFVSGGSILVRASLRHQFEPLPEYAAWEDWWVALRVAQVAEIDYLEAPMIGYRKHGANMNLGADSARMIALEAEVLPMRRWMLTDFESDLVSARDWVGVYMQWATALKCVSEGQGVPVQSLVPVEPEHWEATECAVMRTGEHLAAGELELAARECARALGSNPFAEEAQQALTALLTALDGDRDGGGPADLEVRSFVTLADAEELIEAPALLSGYAETFDADDDASLAILVRHELIPALSTLLADLGLDGADGPDVVGIPVADLAIDLVAGRLTGHCHAVLSRRPASGALRIHPHVDDVSVWRLRSLAERRWCQAPSGF